MATAVQEGGKITLGSFTVDLTDKLGQGSFGVVYRGKHSKEDYIVAVKQCEIQDDNKGSLAMKEIKNFQQLEGHPNIVKLYDFHYTKRSFWMIMQFCDSGDLEKFIIRNNPDIQTMLSIMLQCTTAIHFLHTRRNPVVHRDIKPANILMANEQGKCIAKITDFGLSKVVEDAPDPGITMMFTTAGGTAGFLSPEQFRQEKYTKSVDTFALGLVFLCMIQYKPPMKNLIPRSINSAKNGNIIPIGTEMNMAHSYNIPMPELVIDSADDDNKMKQLKRIIKGMTAYNGKERTSLDEVEKKLLKLTGSAKTLPPLKPGQSFDDNLDSNRETQTELKSGDNNEIGYNLLKDALDQAVLSNISNSGDRKIFENEMANLPFDVLLNYVLGDQKDAKKQFKVGDKVRVINDVDKVLKEPRQLQTWKDEQVHYIGKCGEVTAITPFAIAIKYEDKHSYWWNPSLIRQMNENDRRQDIKQFVNQGNHKRREKVKEKFKRFDVVLMPDNQKHVQEMQNNHGGWNDAMVHCLGVKCIVNEIDQDGDVLIECITGDDWIVNADLLTHVDMAGKEIEAGDLVIISEDQKTVISKQKDHGGWQTNMEHALGKTGTVKKVGTNKCKVECQGRSYIWHNDLLKLVAKGEELMQAILKKTKRE